MDPFTSRWVPALVVGGFLLGVWSLWADPPGETGPPKVERVAVVTDAQVARLEAVLAAMTTTTATLPAADAVAVDRAESVVAGVRSGEVTVIPAPTTSTTVAPAVTATTTVPPATTSTTTAGGVLTWPADLPTTTVPPPDSVVAP